MIFAVEKVNAWKLKGNSPKTVEFHALKKKCKKEFVEIV